MVLGIYERVMNLLENVYRPCHFRDMPALAEYAVTGLAKRARLAYDHLFVSHENADDEKEESEEKENKQHKNEFELFLQRIVKLSIDYVSENSSQQHEFILNLLHSNQQ